MGFTVYYLSLPVLAHLVLVHKTSKTIMPEDGEKVDCADDGQMGQLTKADERVR